MIVECPANTRLQDYLLKNDIHILTPCGGRGNCAKCKVRILKGEAKINTMDQIWFSQKELDEGYRLGCQVFAKEPKNRWPLKYMKSEGVQMKKIRMSMLAVCMAALAGCAQTLSKEQVAPYELSESETQLLEAFGMDQNSQIVSFCAPETVITVTARVYKLKEDLNWEIIGDGSMSIGKEKEPAEQISGSFTMQIQDDRSIDFHINMAGQGAFSTKDIGENQEYTIEGKAFLKEAQKIELGKEIPVSVLVYDNGNSMRSYTTEDYFEPEKFKDMDLVQAVTLEFSDQEIH